MWNSRQAGGCPNYATWVNNPQFFIRNVGKQHGDVLISVQQRDGRLLHKKNDVIGVAVFAADGPTPVSPFPPLVENSKANSS